jgi:hypothetical protein
VAQAIPYGKDRTQKALELTIEDFLVFFSVISEIRVRNYGFLAKNGLPARKLVN